MTSMTESIYNNIILQLISTEKDDDIVDLVLDWRNLVKYFAN